MFAYPGRRCSKFTEHLQLVVCAVEVPATPAPTAHRHETGVGTGSALARACVRARAREGEKVGVRATTALRRAFDQFLGVGFQ
jgi:hypothetical protein